MGIDDDIANLKEKIAKVEREAELLHAELRGMLVAKKYLEGSAVRAAGAVVASGAARAANAVTRRGGRQPGAISDRWKEILSALYQLDAWFDESAVVNTVFELDNRHIKPTEVRRIFTGYVEHGYIEKGDRDLYRVTEEAAAKFGFPPKPKPENAKPAPAKALNLVKTEPFDFEKEMMRTFQEGVLK
jgi:hypothetical protein